MSNGVQRGRYVVIDEGITRSSRLSSLLRPIAFHPVLVDICDGSINAALMLSQILYWTPRCGPESDGWFYKTQNQWFEELRLTRTQQDNARSILRQHGYIEESLKSCHAGTVKHFRACLETIEKEIERLQVSNIPVCRKPANTLAGNLQRNKEQETTTETTFNLAPPSSGRVPVEKSKPKKKLSSADPRRQEFIDHLAKGYKNRGWKFYFNGKDGVQLDNLLKGHRDMTLEDFNKCLKHYFQSEGSIPGDAPYAYLAKLPRYHHGPLNQYGKLMDCAPAGVEL